MPDYIVKVIARAHDTTAIQHTAERLIRAKNQARALAHVVKDTLEVKVATIDDAIRMSKEGVEIEVAE